MSAIDTVRKWPVLPKEVWTRISEAYLNPIAAICLVQSPWVGLGLWGVLLLQPALAFAGALSLTALELLSARHRRVSGQQWFKVTDRANGLLSAIAGAWIFLPADQSFALRVLMIAAIVFAGLLFTFLAKDLVGKSRLPVLVWPYCAIAFIAFTIFPEASARAIEYFQWPLFEIDSFWDLPQIFLRSMGVFLFSPSLLSGILIACVLLAWSPAMLLAGMTGWIAGVLASSILVAAGAPIYWGAASYNFFLSGAALGAVFFVPGLRSLSFAALGGAMSALIAALLQVLLDYSAVSFLPIPFAVTLYSGLVLLAAPPFGTPQDLVASWGVKPEENRVSRDWLIARWGDPGTPLLGIPVQGTLEITQGFDDDLSHRGDWRHALDFQRPVSAGTGAQTRPSLWGEAVFSPIVGTVIGAKDSVADNTQGEVNYADNWGNYVVLETATGDQVLLGHLMQKSLLVATGQSVGYATEVGLVGNSGRSPVPHLHLQAQVGDEAGAPTRDFRLANYFLCDPSTLFGF